MINSDLLADRLKAARKARGLTQAAAAGAVELSRTTVVAIEKGVRPVRPEELIRFARIYDRSANELLRPGTREGELVGQFRLAPSASEPDEGSNASVAMLQQLTDDYLELEKLTASPLPRHYPLEESINSFDPESDGAVLADAERNRLGIGDGPLLALRQLLETDIGLRVFAINLPSKVAGVYAFSDAHGGCIGFNAKHPLGRQRWSLAHEYAHFIAQRRATEVTPEGASRRRPASERFADAFASAFLMPEAGLRRRFRSQVATHAGDATAADLLQLADRYQVSFQAITLRLEDLRLIRSGALDRLMAASFNIKEARELLHLASDTPDTETLPPRYKYLAVKAYDSGDISEGQLARFLRIDRVSARGLVAALTPRHSDEADADQQRGLLSMDWPLTSPGA